MNLIKLKLNMITQKLKNGGQMEDLGRHKNTVQLVRVKKREKPVDPELPCPRGKACSGGKKKRRQKSEADL